MAAPLNVDSGHVYPVPKPGCYVPAITFFDPETDKLCPVEQGKYYSYLSKTGLRGLVILGTNAETLLLTREERKTLLEIARQSVPPDFPIIAGVSGHSTAQVTEYINDACAAGANFVLLLPCAYFGKQTTPDVTRDFFAQIADTSPLPIVLYNFPAVCNGVDLDSDIIAEIAQHPKVVGVKLTCGSVAKITRLAAVFPPHRFAIFGGQSDFLVGGLAAGSSGCIAAFGNVFPRAIVQVFDLWTQGKHQEALKLQRVLALAESLTKAGIANTKYAAAVFTAPRAGIENGVALSKPRRPYHAPSFQAQEKIKNVMKAANQAEVEIESLQL